MFIIIWEYQVKPERQIEFEKIYASNGAWGELFRKGLGYLGTELLHDKETPLRYLTMDRWNSKAEYENFLAQYGREYQALDAECEGLTEQESPLGKWHPV